MRILAVAFAAVTCSDYVIHGGVADNLYFLETFGVASDTDRSAGSEDLHGDHRWIKSKVGKYLNQPVLIKPPNKPVKGFESDNGLQLTQEMKHYGLSCQLNHPFDFSLQQDFVIQYEVRLEESLECGGAYIKLLREVNQSSLEELSNDTPYSIMFGPDKCGSTNKVHFIIQYRNPITGVWTEHHYNETLSAKVDKSTHLYTLHIKADSTFDIYVDMKLAKSGSLLTNLTPPINPAEFIDDPNDVKPSEWVDSATIPDPDAIKPDDWDESQPLKIPDNNAVKPAAWDEDAPLTVPDPSAVKPDDWDDEEDGDWEAPSVPNPFCDSAGCGPWSPPMIPNPLHKGKWKRPQITNPAYKGPWKAAQIRNPGFFSDPQPVQTIAPVQAIAVEVWTITAGIIFDNFLIATSINDALKYARETTALKVNTEKEVQKQQETAAKQQSWKQLLESGSYSDLVVHLVQQLSQLVADNPVATATSVALIVLTFLYLVFFGGNKEVAPINSSSSSTASEGRGSQEPAEGDTVVTGVPDPDLATKGGTVNGDSRTD